MQFDWLPEGDVPADPVCDFRTVENKASVWKIENAQEDQCLFPIMRIAVAVAARRDSVGSLDYFLLDSAAVDAVGIEVCKDTNGKSADRELNESIHYNLEKISAGKLTELVSTVLSKAGVERIHPKDLAIEIWDGLCKKHLDERLVKPKLLIDAAERILMDLASTKLEPSTSRREAIEAAAKHYLHEHDKEQFPQKRTKDTYAEEAKKWIS